MKTGTVLVATLALASFPLVAQQSAPESTPSSPPAMRPNSPAGQQSTSPATEPERPGSASASAATPTAQASAPAELRAVKGELVSKLDTKTAKTGDDVVVQTKSAVKTADGTEIPKGSKLMGHVLAVKASSAGQNSQVALQFDHAELAGGQSVPIQTQIQAIGSGSEASSSGPSEMGAPSTSNSSPGMNGASPSANGAASPERSPAAAGSSPGYAPAPSASAGAVSSGPAAGTVVARTGNIAIRATSVPGVLLANNEAGARDPRMAQASSILLGAQKDVQLNSGTPVIVGVAASSGGATK